MYICHSGLCLLNRIFHIPGHFIVIQQTAYAAFTIIHFFYDGCKALYQVAGIISYFGEFIDDLVHIQWVHYRQFFSIINRFITCSATGSDHYIQFSQPDLVVQTTELIERRARP